MQQSLSFLDEFAGQRGEILSAEFERKIASRDMSDSLDLFEIALALDEVLRRLIEPEVMGDPIRPLLWVSKSHAKLATELADFHVRLGNIRGYPEIQDSLFLPDNHRSKKGKSKYQRESSLPRLYAQRCFSLQRLDDGVHF